MKEWGRGEGGGGEGAKWPEEENKVIITQYKMIECHKTQRTLWTIEAGKMEIKNLFQSVLKLCHFESFGDVRFFQIKLYEMFGHQGKVFSEMVT